MFRFSTIILLAITLVATFFTSPDTSSATTNDPSKFRIATSNGKPRVEILCDGQVFLTSPAEGLWSIATGWKNGWPSDWQHTSPEETIRRGPWTVLSGKLELPGGTWRLRDAYRQDGPAVRCVRRYTFEGTSSAKRATLSVRFQAKATGAEALLPGIIYYGNPMGAKSGRVPVYNGKPGEESLFEEHRYPVPMAAIEWRTDGEKDGGHLLGAALHSLPSPVPYANLPDQWWSLGLEATSDHTELKLLSGPICSNGQRSKVKAVQRGFLPYDNAYLDVPPGATIEKTFWLEAYPVDRRGSGFRRPLHTAIKRLQPCEAADLPGFKEIIQAKYRFAKRRWYESDKNTTTGFPIAGFRKYPNKNQLVFGWCGQAAAPSYALQVLGDRLEANSDPDSQKPGPNAAQMAQKSLDFLSTAKFYDGGFHTWYDCDKKRWHGHETLSQAQGMLNFARAIRVGRKSDRFKTDRWESFLRRACDFHARRILRDDWHPKSTSDGFFIAPLCKAAMLFKSDTDRRTTYRKAALKAADHYAKRHLTMREPYWGGTLDARCEDKEGAFAALQGFLAAYELTGDRRYLDYAQHAADVVLTYVVLWDIDLPAGRLRDHGFKTRGWTVVSPQNQHIDVYGVLIAPDIYRLGNYLDRDDLRRIAILMYRTCGQLIDPYGSQGEQPQHTQYAQRGNMTDVFSMRGQYAEHWTVFWITAHFLVAAAELEELGVSVWE
ncbi:MAG: hypothetical protein U9N87_07220 [Planctomycetota bacterium]|nr:hypothetical protein [Planctomycetota bacterium]